jgi:hypothetical protein
LNSLRGTKIFDASKRPIRYIIGLQIMKQLLPVWYNSSVLEEY